MFVLPWKNSVPWSQCCPGHALISQTEQCAKVLTSFIVSSKFWFSVELDIFCLGKFSIANKKESDLQLLVLFNGIYFIAYCVCKMEQVHVFLASWKRAWTVVKNYAGGQNCKCLIYLLFNAGGWLEERKRFMPQVRIHVCGALQFA